MNIISSFFTSLLVFLHVITPVSAPIVLPTPVVSATPIVSQQPVKKPVVVPIVDSPQVSKCKLEASLAVDKLSDIFIKSSESKLVSNPLYRQRYLLQETKVRTLARYEIEVFSAYERTIIEQKDEVKIEALIKIISNQLINSQKELQDNFNRLVSQQYELVYLQCINR